MSRLARPTPTRQAFRPDLEGLRAIAVLLVVAYHAGLTVLPGGYVGVDVFYVLSGFFITGLLLAEITKTGRIHLTGFYARRARRLLPAATVVIVATAVASWFLYPPLRLPDIGWDALASAGNLVNVRYALQSTNYLAATDPSPYLHFWSLAVEEQFYWVWPLLVATGVGVLLSRRTPSRVRLTITLSVVTVLSLSAGVALTGVNQPYAFFLLPTRAWELGAGALLALAVTRLDALATWIRALSGVTGLAGIIAASIWFTDQTAFPGIAALLPVAGTVFLIVAGAGNSSPVSDLLSIRPLRAIGRWSYSIYLWHWPLLILPTVALGEELSWPFRLGFAAASIGLGAVTYWFVENPIRRSPALSTSNGRSLGVAAACVSAGLAAGAALITLPAIVHPLSSDRPSASTSMELADALAISSVPSTLNPSLQAADGDRPVSYNDGCHLDFAGTQFSNCVYGDPTSTTTVMLVGDSHAAQWLPALTEIANIHHWKVIALTKSACPATSAITDHPSDAGRSYTECADAHTAILARITSEHPDLVVLASFASLKAIPDSEKASWYGGIRDFTRQVLTAGAESAVVLGDTPHPVVHVPNCLSAHLDEVTACVARFSDAVSVDNERRTKDAASAAGAQYVQTSEWLCIPGGCPVIAGSTLLYRDDSHLTTVASRWLSARLDTALNLVTG